MRNSKKQNNYAFIDSQNLNLGVKNDLRWNLDYRKFRVYLKEKYDIVQAYLFIGYIQENKDMYQKLQEYGYILIFKPILTYKDGTVKGNVDADLVLQVMRNYNNNRFNKAIIVSSDGDFYCLVEYLYERNKLLKVMSPNRKKCSVLLRKKGKEKMVYLSNLRKKLEYHIKFSGNNTINKKSIA